MKEFFSKLFYPITAPINFIQNHFKAVVLVLIVILITNSQESEDFIPNNLEHIKLTGPIFEVSELLQKIDDATSDSNIKGVLFEVNSPGGAVAPSVEIAYAIKRLSEVKPVVVYASGMIASGGYYASIWADEIIANPGSMVGSIGVIMHGTNLEGIMQKIGIKSQIVQAGKYKQVGTTDREWNQIERAELEKVIQSTYNQFVSDVADGRELNVSNSHIFADAHIFTAAQAQQVGLIDSLGVLHDAKNRVAILAGETSPKWNKEDQMDKLLKKLTTQTASMVQTYFPSISMR